MDRGVEKEEVSLFPDGHWSLMEHSELPWQFGPDSPLDCGSKYITLEETSSLEEFESTKKTVLDEAFGFKFDWQCIMDEGFTDYRLFSSKLVDSAEMDMITKNVPSEALPISNESESASMTIESKSEQCFKGQKFSKLEQSSKQHESRSLERLTASRGSPSCWWRVDSNELAALVSQKSHEHMENCDLPRSPCSFTSKGTFLLGSTCSRSDRSPSMVDKAQFGLCLSKSLSSSPELTDTLKHKPLKQQMSKIVMQPSKSNGNQLRNSGDSQKHRVGKNPRATGRELLGEALCHSQTRARKAEKLAYQLLQEKEKLAILLFREAWTVRTYKQWIEILEMENMWLRLQLKDETKSNFEDMAHGSWKYLHKHPTRSKIYHCFASSSEGKAQKHKWSSGDNFIVRCTVGFAFALGLSFASAGFMFGWSMGWILLGY